MVESGARRVGAAGVVVAGAGAASAGPGNPPRLGFDIGRVIIGGPPPGAGEDTGFFGGDIEAAMQTPAIDGAFDAVAHLASAVQGRAWLVSKGSARTEDRTRRWLAHHRFFERTGIAPDHARYCRERADKAVHCAELGITHFVDDHLDVLEVLRPVVPHLFLFGEQEIDPPGWVVPVAGWPAAIEAITATLARG